MSYTQFNRESVNRHQSERLLDRNLIHFERKQPLETYEKALEKKIKKEEEQKKIDEEKIKQIKSLDLKPNDILDKLLKHLTNAQKSAKAIVMIKELIEKNYDSLEPEHIFYALYEIMKNFRNLGNPDDKKAIRAIFELIQKKKDKVLDTTNKKRAFDAWSIEAFQHTEIFTDDSFTFNNAVKKVKEIIDSLHNKTSDDFKIEIEEPKAQPQVQAQIPAENKPEEKKSSVLDSIKNKLSKKTVEEPEASKPNIDKIRDKLKKKTEDESLVPAVPIIEKKYEYELPEEVKTFLVQFGDNFSNSQADKKNFLNAKLDILYEIIGDLYKKYKTIWAKPTIKQFFDDLYMKRDIFNEEQKKGVEDYKATLNSMRNMDTAKGIRKEVWDSKIVSNPLAANFEVKDARATSFAMSGIDRWANKQTGN